MRDSGSLGRGSIPFGATTTKRETSCADFRANGFPLLFYYKRGFNSMCLRQELNLKLRHQKRIGYPKISSELKQPKSSRQSNEDLKTQRCTNTLCTSIGAYLQHDHNEYQPILFLTNSLLSIPLPVANPRFVHHKIARQ